MRFLDAFPSRERKRAVPGQAAAYGITGIMRILRAIAFLPMALALSHAQPAVEIRVDGEARLGPFRPIYSYFGYDEPNYTYSANGKKLMANWPR